MNLFKERFYRKIYYPENLMRAWKLIRAKKGVPGPDGITIQDYEENIGDNLFLIQRQLEKREYKPGPVRFVEITSSNGKKRQLGIPNVHDRIVQRAALNVLLPQFENIFLNCNYGYRPGRSVQAACRRVKRLYKWGFEWVVDADIQDYFGSVDHRLMKRFIAEDIADRKVVRLLNSWIDLHRTGVRSFMPFLPGRYAGLIQGAVINPLLSNIYLHRFDLRMVGNGYHLVRYCDDFVIMCESRDKAAAARRAALFNLFRLRLRLNKKKSRIVHYSKGFKFLGKRFGIPKRGNSREMESNPFENMNLIPANGKGDNGHEHSIRDDPGRYAEAGGRASCSEL